MHELTVKLVKLFARDEYRDDYETMEQHHEKYIRNLHKLSKQQRVVVLEDLYKEYGDKDTYEIKDEDCFSFLMDYAKQYGKKCLPYHTYHVKYEIDYAFVVEEEFYVDDVNKDCTWRFYPNYHKVLPHFFKENYVEVLTPESTVLVKTNDSLCFNDILLQIKKKKLDGYAVQIGSKKFSILNDGSIENNPIIFLTAHDQLNRLNQNSTLVSDEIRKLQKENEKLKKRLKTITDEKEFLEFEVNQLRT